LNVWRCRRASARCGGLAMVRRIAGRLEGLKKGTQTGLLWSGTGGLAVYRACAMFLYQVDHMWHSLPWPRVAAALSWRACGCAPAWP
jgi:hypothetical protein